ncbi:MAG TPA: hypothetical protein VM124_00190 [Candidatus Limnocylindrales bacterium]|nr:hypothetical protein [Candidatus Limnocylindrales bacterium]
MSPNSLPRVSHETRGALLGTWRENPNFISDTYQRLLLEQPALTDQIAGYITARAKSPEASVNMLETFVLTYALLESQAEAQGLSGMFAPETPES